MKKDRKLKAKLQALQNELQLVNKSKNKKAAFTIVNKEDSKIIQTNDFKFKEIKKDLVKTLIFMTLSFTLIYFSQYFI